MMLTRWLETKSAIAPTRKTLLRMDWLEARENPSLTIQFDYSYDSSHFFDQQSRRDILQLAANNLASRIDTTLGAIAPNVGAGNTWTLTTFNPADPFNHNADITLTNFNVATGTITVFAGAQAGLGGGEAGLGGFGGYSASGSQPWLTSLGTRGVGGFAPWGGSITFDTTTNWNFSTNGPGSQQIDFYTVATHELAHVLGFGTAQQYNQYVSGDIFFGPNATAANGGQYPHLHSNADQSHWRQGLTSYGQAVAMQPVVVAGTRVTFSELDYAVLSDVGWTVSGYVSPVGPAPGAPSGGNSAPIPTSPIVANNFALGQVPAAVSSGNGTFQLYNASAGNLNPVGSPVNAFPGYTGSVRVATGDVNGDGVQDIIVAAGAGGGPHVKIFDGATGQLVQSFFAFDPGFTGGIFVAAADIDNDGRDDVIITPDVGGGTHVRIFSGGDPGRPMASFFGIDAPGFLGGARTAAGDIDGDGYADLVVTAGVGGGSHTVVWSGRQLGTGQLVRLTEDFFAIDPSFANDKNGVFVAVTDLDGDGFDDLVFGAGNRVRVLSGQLTKNRGGAAAAAAPSNDFFVGDGSVKQSVRLAGGDFDGNGRGEVLIGSADGQAGMVYRLTENGLMSLSITNSPLASGIYVG